MPSTGKAIRVLLMFAHHKKLVSAQDLRRLCFHAARDAYAVGRRRIAFSSVGRARGAVVPSTLLGLAVQAYGLNARAYAVNVMTSALLNIAPR